MTTIRNKSREINASDLEHIGAMLAGGYLLLKGLRHKGMVGQLYRIAGVGLVWRGQNGYRRLYEAMGWNLPRRPTGVSGRNRRVESRIVVNRPRSEIYRIWRELSNLPVFMDHLLSVYEIDDTHSLWAARAPGGLVIKWEAEIINDIEDELIAWQSLEGSGVDVVGSVHFDDAPEGGTAIKIVLRYDPPGDIIGAAVARVFRNDPQMQIDRDLHRFKRILELGEERREDHRARTSVL